MKPSSTATISVIGGETAPMSLRLHAPSQLHLPKLQTIKRQIYSVRADVEMSIEVFTGMGHNRVAKRCVELVTEVYELSKKAVKEQQEGHPELAVN